MMILILMCMALVLSVASAASAAAVAPIAFNGFDVVECMSMHADGTTCNAIGSSEYSTDYTSVDKDGTPRFTSRFLFTNQNNMIAFENAPYSFVPRVGGFCAWAIANQNSTSPSPWSENSLGPPVDLLHSWRVIPQPDGLPPALFLFGGEQGANDFISSLPQSQRQAEATWSTWWGTHGTVAPYALSGGPFNSACFSAGGSTSPARDCSKDPMVIPSR